MATDLEKLVVSLEANLKNYEKEMARANNITVRELRQVEKSAQGSMSRIENGFTRLGGSIKAGLAGAAVGALAAFGIAAKSAISDAAKIGDLADKIGVTTDELQGLAYGAVQADMGFEDLSGSLLKFSKAVGQARNGQGELLSTLEANGFDKAKIKALTYSEALGVVADLVKNAKNEQDQLLIITQAFGRGGDGMLEFLKNGSAGLRKFGQEATDAGAKIDEALIRKAQEIDDRWAALMLSMTTKTKSAVLTIVDDLSKIGEIDPNFMTGRGPQRPRQSRTLGAATYPRISGQTSPGGPGPFANFPAAVTPSRPTIIADPQAEAAATKAANAAESERNRLAREAAQVAKEKAKAIQDVISQLKFETEQIGKSDLQQQINNELRNAGVTAASKQGKEIAALVAKQYELAAAQEYTTKAAEFSQKQMDYLRQANEELLSSQMELAGMAVDALSQIATGGAKAGDVIKNLANQLLQAATQAALLGQGPLASIFGTSGTGGFFGSLFKGGFGSATAGIYHSGGIVGAGGPTRSVNPAMFAGAPRYHSGGVAGLQPGEVPAILQKGEMVIPKGGKSGGGQGVTIVDQRKNAPAIERGTDSRGNLQLLIRDAVRNELPGQLRKQMPAQFNLKPANRPR